MKIIFSRKGFDSESGRVASPILPDGRMFSLPIPSPGLTGEHAVCFDDLRVNGVNYGELVSELTGENIPGSTTTHLDPDLVREQRSRRPGWRAGLGQVLSAEGVLTRAGVGPGDLFLYFGWFRRASRNSLRWRFVDGAPDLHVLFGWLQVWRKLPANDPELEELVPEHPHVCRWTDGVGDSVYLGTEWLDLPGLDRTISGAGVFPRFADRLCLTCQDPYKSRSRWRLPAFFHPAPSEGRSRASFLGYHGKPDRWTLEEDGRTVLLDAVARGQEFVLDCDDYPEAVAWAAELISGFAPAEEKKG